jgi:hypothetical protein
MTDTSAREDSAAALADDSETKAPREATDSGAVPGR